MIHGQPFPMFSFASINRAVAVAQFNSLYESFQALTQVQDTHFIDWCSGSSISTLWTEVDSGAGTFQMSDAIDEGFEIIEDGSGNNMALTFNNIRHYSQTAGEMIMVVRRANATMLACGFFNTDIATSQLNSAFARDNEGTDTNINLVTGDASTTTATASSVASSTNFHVLKIECASANIKLYVDGVLEVTKTTNRPAARLQPHIGLGARAVSGRKIQCRFLEVHNTESPPISSTIYERLSALTQVMKQRVDETFAGSDVDTDRWTKQDTAGTGTFAMSDSIDGGFSIKSGSNVNDQSEILFNDIRQYSYDDSVAIFTVARISGTCQIFCGLEGSKTVSTSSYSRLYDRSSNSFKKLATHDGSSSSDTDSSVAVDTSFHIYKIENGSANIKLYIDGVLEVTKTTNRPTTKLMPVIVVSNISTGAARELQIRYFEAYNKLTTETDYPSVYELKNPLTTVAKAWFWDWMDGDSLHNRWTTEDISGTNTFAMNDAIDGGFKITNQAVASAKGAIHFNDKRQFSQTASELIAVHKRGTADSDCTVGFRNDASSDLNLANLRELTTNTFKTLITGDGSSNSETNSSIAIDTSWHNYKIECGSANIKLYIDGVLEVTKTTNRPADKLQPMMRNDNTSTTSATSSIRYCEAYNT